jgi:hypothetical protein
VPKTSDRNLVQQEVGGGKEGKEHSVGILHFVSDEKVMISCIYFHVCGGAGGMCGEEGKQSSLSGLHIHFTVGP